MFSNNLRIRAPSAFKLHWDVTSLMLQCETESNFDSLLDCSISDVTSQCSLNAEGARMRRLLENMNHNVNVTQRRCSNLEERLGKLREERNTLRRDLAEEKKKKDAILEEIA